VSIAATGEILVEVHARNEGPVLCDFLQVTQEPSVTLAAGNTVLVVLPSAGEEKGCVLGRVGPYVAPETDTVTITAKRELTLQCGEAAITLRHDGKVLTRAVDIAAVAKRRHRIKGGSVDIN
jgi:hypothetical protein